jgi:hypothetical protein
MAQLSRVLVVAVALAVGTAACSDEEPVAAADLQTELEQLRDRIAEATGTAETHAGGLLGEIAATRREVLLLSAAMLENKLIAEQGGVPSQLVVQVTAPNPARAEQLLRHIAAAEDELEKIEDAAGQRDGMAGSLSQTAIATHELTIAQLRQAYFEAAYGLALPGPGGGRSAAATAEEPPLTTSAPPAAAAAAAAAAGPATDNAEETETPAAAPQVAAAPPPQAPAPPRSYGRTDYLRIQKQLKQFGYDPGPVDGAWGPKTRRALTAFQASAGLPPTGEPNAASLNALGLD